MWLFRLLLPATYIAASAVLLTVFGGAGHGRGMTAFYYLGLPLSYISLLVEDVFRSGELAMLSCLTGGVVQYFLLGLLLDRFIRAKYRSRTDR
jgi:hypothetical protein